MLEVLSQCLDYPIGAPSQCGPDPFPPHYMRTWVDLCNSPSRDVPLPQLVSIVSANDQLNRAPTGRALCIRGSRPGLYSGRLRLVLSGSMRPAPTFDLFYDLKASSKDNPCDARIEIYQLQFVRRFPADEPVEPVEPTFVLMSRMAIKAYRKFVELLEDRAVGADPSFF